MPAAQFYIKTTNTTSPTYTDGQTHVDSDGWVDAFTTYGLSLSDGALSRLLTPAGNKSGITTALITQHGTNTLSYPDRKEVRQLSLEVHILAPDKETFLTRYKAFVSQVLDAGYIRVKHAVDPSTVYHLKYVDCQQFSQFRCEMAKFILSLEEPRPDIRYETGTIGIPKNLQS